MVIDAEGNLFVGLLTNQITRITPTRIPIPFSNSALLNAPLGMTAGDDGTLYISNAVRSGTSSAILQATSDGTVMELARIPGTLGFLTYANDRLYVVAQSDRRIYQVTLEGEVSALAGTGFSGLTDGAAFEASFYRPYGIAASITGDTLYVNDSGDINSSTVHPNVIRMITGVHNAITSPVANEEASEVPDGFALEQNYPNPFNPSTDIRFTLSQTGPVTLTVYDLFGREVATLVNGHKAAGSHEVVFDAGALASGFYVYRLHAGRFSETKVMTLLK